MQYTDQDLLKLVNEVEKEFTAHLTKAESTLAKSEEANGSAAPAEKVETLAKAEDGEKPEAKPEAKEDKPEAKEDKPADKEAPPAEGEKKPEAEAKAPAEGEKAPEGEKEAAPAAPAADAAQPSDACDYDAEDMAHMQKMYASMSKGELKAHHDACRAALDSQGMEKCGDMSMGKSEDDKSVDVSNIVVPTPSPEVELLKSENEAHKAKVADLQKSLDAVTAFITKLVEKKVAPQGKAITSLEVIAKSEEAKEEKELTKGEITQILAKKSADPSLKKSDRDAINAFYLNGASIQTISHLLK